MSIWLLLQIAFNVILFLGIWILWTKFRRPPKNDPRLSKGLQLLQSKISVLEDLSDKTDTQVSQLAALLEKKCREIQARMQEADKCMDRIDQSVEKSLDVASIFEDRIPHQEIIDRQRTKSYIKAAQLAHQGQTLEEIAEQVDLNQGELEMIVKVNRDRLMFSKDDLPAWATDDAEDDELAVDFKLKNQEFVEGDKREIQPDLSNVFRPVVEPPESLGKLGEEFRKVCQEVEEQEKEMAVESTTERVVQQLSSSAVNGLRKFSQTAKEKISNTLNEVSILDGDEKEHNAEAQSESVIRNDHSELFEEVSKLTSPLNELNKIRTSPSTEDLSVEKTSESLKSSQENLNESRIIDSSSESSAETEIVKRAEEGMNAESATLEDEIIDLDGDVAKPEAEQSTIKKAMATPLVKPSRADLASDKAKKITSHKIVRDVEVKKVVFPKIEMPQDQL